MDPRTNEVVSFILGGLKGVGYLLLVMAFIIGVPAFGIGVGFVASIYPIQTIVVGFVIAIGLAFYAGAMGYM